MRNILTKIFGAKHERDHKRMQPFIEQISALEAEISSLSDAGLRAKTQEFKDYIKEKEKDWEEEIKDLETQFDEVPPEEMLKIRRRLNIIRNEIVADILPQAFAVVREASKRTTGMRHFDVQLMGGIVLHEGKIAEMATGEGKTLVASLSLYLNALFCRGCHLVTVNDYLAKRDRYWMGPIYEFLDMSVGFIQHDMPPEERKKAYHCDITYGTNNEFGFDFLRDNMAVHPEARVQRKFFYAIVDEVDSILIDEARTPLIISGPAEESTSLYFEVDRFIPALKKDVDFNVEEKEHTVVLTDAGMLKCEELARRTNLLGKEESLFDNARLASHITQALRAHNLYKRDEDYVVKDGKVIIVDEFTGRLMPGRRWSEGLHQAVEARERVNIERENQTLATITFQNYFRLYEKLAGMTGTAETEAVEFKKIYDLDVSVLPPNRSLIRQEDPDMIYKTEKEKDKAIISEIEEVHKKGRPILVGTRSIEKNEKISRMLKEIGLPHEVLNAKHHEREASIIAQAGRKAAITVATNMAGRGTDIVLGGNAEFLVKDLLRQRGLDPSDENYQKELEELLPRFKDKVEKEHKEVVEVRGLHVLGSERHEARRIDNQLRGRSGRQGDPGSSRFFLSLEDELLRLFGSERIAAIMDRLGIEEGEPIEHPWISRAIGIAQKRVEGHHFDIRKQLLEFDNVMNEQRKVIYRERNKVFEGKNLKPEIMGMLENEFSDICDIYLLPKVSSADWDIAGFDARLKSLFGLSVSEEDIRATKGKNLKEDLLQAIRNIYEAREKQFGQEQMRGMERMVMLQVVDMSWKDHLYSMDRLREGIGLRGYGQRDPVIEYKKEAYEMFERLNLKIREEVLQFLFRAQFRPQPIRRTPPRTPAGAPGAPGIPGTPGIPPSVAPGSPFPASSQQRTPAAGHPSVSRQHPTGKAREEIPLRKRYRIGRNDPCPCGSGKKYKRCCGRNA